MKKIDYQKELSILKTRHIKFLDNLIAIFWIFGLTILTIFVYIVNVYYGTHQIEKASTFLAICLSITFSSWFLSITTMIIDISLWKKYKNNIKIKPLKSKDFLTSNFRWIILIILSFNVFIYLITFLYTYWTEHRDWSLCCVCFMIAYFVAIVIVLLILLTMYLTNKKQKNQIKEEFNEKE